MLSNSLSAGDKISIKAWFGWTELYVKLDDGKLMASSKNKDITIPVSTLSFTSKELTPYSKWKISWQISGDRGRVHRCMKRQDEEEDDLLEKFLNI